MSQRYAYARYITNLNYINSIILQTLLSVLNAIATVFGVVSCLG